jgi:hypothetical protein
MKKQGNIGYPKGAPAKDKKPDVKPAHSKAKHK